MGSEIFCSFSGQKKYPLRKLATIDSSAVKFLFNGVRNICDSVALKFHYIEICSERPV